MKIKNIIKTILSKLMIKKNEKNEIKKFKDKRRKEIYSKIILSKEQIKEIDEIYIKNFGKKIPYTWHRHFTSFTGNFDKYYFPELLYIPDFEYFMNIEKYYGKAFGDKNIMPLVANSVGINFPKTIVSSVDNLYRNGKCEQISKEDVLKVLENYGECFAKPSVGTGSGKGCMLLNIENGIDKNTNLSVEKIINNLGRNFVIQEKIECHESVLKLYSQSVNTFRIISYRWKDKILFVPSTMRIGRGGNYLDNAHAGGIFIAIDDDGKLHKKAFSEFKEEYEIHPDSKIKFENYKIDLFPKVLETAKKMHLLMPQIGSVNWDFTIDNKGNPVLIEANFFGRWYMASTNGTWKRSIWRINSRNNKMDKIYEKY